MAECVGGKEEREGVADLGDGEGVLSDGDEVGGVGVVDVDRVFGWETEVGLSKNGSTAAPAAPAAPTAASAASPSMPEAVASTSKEPPTLQKCETGGGAEEKAGRIFESRTSRSEEPAAKVDSSTGGDEVTGIGGLLEDGSFDGHGSEDLGSTERYHSPSSSLRSERERGGSHVSDDERDTDSGFNGDGMPTLSKPGRPEKHSGTRKRGAGGQPKRPVREVRRWGGGDGGKASAGSFQHVEGEFPAPTVEDGGGSASFRRVDGDNMESREGSRPTIHEEEVDSASTITGGDSSGEKRSASAKKGSASANGGINTDGRHHNVDMIQGGRRSPQPRLDEELCDPRNRLHGTVYDSAEEHASDERSATSSIKASVATSVNQAGQESRAADSGNNSDCEGRKGLGDRGTGGGGEGGGGKRSGGQRSEGEKHAAITDEEDEYGSDFASQVRLMSWHRPIV